MSSINLAYAEEALLLTLTDESITNAATVGISGGLTGALNSAENRSHAKQIRIANDNESGHIRQVRVATKQRLTKDDQPDLELDGCEFGDEIPYLEETINITQQDAVSFTIAESTIREYPKIVTELVRLTGAKTAMQIVQKARQSGAGSDALDVIREMSGDVILSMNAMIQKMNTKLATDFSAKVGTWQGGSASNAYIVQNAEAYASGGGGINAGGLFKFKQDMRKTKFPGTPHVVTGYGALERVAAQDGRYFGQGANGVNYGDVRANMDQVMRLFVDENIVDILGSEDDALVFMPGSANLLAWNKYVGSFGQIGTMWRFTLPIPQIPDVRLDCKIMPDECPETYGVKMGLHYELYIPQMELFKSTDKLYGVNGTFEASFTQAS